jgi:hypothetical protein
MAMGRTRTTRKDLPRRMYHHHGAYSFRAPDGRRVNLGRDLAVELVADPGVPTAGEIVGRDDPVDERTQRGPLGLRQHDRVPGTLLGSLPWIRIDPSVAPNACQSAFS